MNLIKRLLNGFKKEQYVKDVEKANREGMTYIPRTSNPKEVLPRSMEEKE